MLYLRPIPASAHIHRSKRSSSTARWPSSNLIEVTIDDLPEAALVEILCRLPSCKIVSPCKCVSKRWRNLINDPYFIGCFLCIQSDHKHTPILRTVIRSDGEFLSRKSCFSPKSLTPMFKRLMSCHKLKEVRVVVGTYNDLVLCCASECDQRDYYICNPYTMQ